MSTILAMAHGCGERIAAPPSTRRPAARTAPRPELGPAAPPLAPCAAVARTAHRAGGAALRGHGAGSPATVCMLQPTPPNRWLAPRVPAQAVLYGVGTGATVEFAFTVMISVRWRASPALPCSSAPAWLQAQLRA